MSQKGKKRLLVEIGDGYGGEVEVFRFKILLPNGTSVGLNLRDPGPKMPFDEFIKLVKEEYFRLWKQSESMKRKKCVDWKGGLLFLQDANDVKIRSVLDFKSFKPHKCHILRLHVSI